LNIDMRNRINHFYHLEMLEHSLKCQ
jgi:hypothetical protein